MLKDRLDFLGLGGLTAQWQSERQHKAWRQDHAERLIESLLDRHGQHVRRRSVEADDLALTIDRQEPVADAAEDSVLRGLHRLDLASVRSEERRVGKECRSRWSPYH